MIRLVDNTAAAVKTKDVVTHAARPAGLHLVFVSEKFLAGVAAAVVKLGVGENSEKRAFTGIHVPDHRHPVTTSTMQI